MSALLVVLMVIFLALFLVLFLVAGSGFSAMTLAAETPSGDFARALTISDAPIPHGGERPFVVRAQLPADAKRAKISLTAVADRDASRPDAFVLQQQGSGWGHDLPENMIIAAESH